MNFEARSYKKELLDGDHIPFADIRQNMQELNVINTLLGGHKITCKGVDLFLKDTRLTDSISIAEIGCGGGDNLVAVRKMLERKKRNYSMTGIDINPECVETAKQNSNENINWICSDYRNISWPDGKPDILFSSLFCHHFTDEQLVEQLLWMKDNSRIGFFINDLQRHPLAYYSISLLTRVFSNSYLVKNDAPLSVLRGFVKKDWEQLLCKAGIKGYSIQWQWAFRYLICISNE